jgi:hypothetical protein
MANRSLLWALSVAILLMALVGLTSFQGARGRTSIAGVDAAAPSVRPAGVPAPSVVQAVRAPALPTVAVAPSDTSEPELDVRARVVELAASIASLMHAHLYEGEAGRELRRCAPRESEPCQELLSATLYEVLAQYVEGDLVAGKLGAAEIESLDPELVHAAAAQLLERSTDPVERVGLLALLTRATELKPVAFPTAVYRELSRKPVVEAQLLLGRSVHTGLPDARTIEEVAYLAAGQGVDPRVQGMALAALARPATADSLNGAVRTLARSHGPEWHGWRSTVAMALGICGKPCSDVTAEVVASSSEADALAEYVLQLTRRSDRSELVARLSPVLSESTLDQFRDDLGE